MSEGEFFVFEPDVGGFEVKGAGDGVGGLEGGGFDRLVHVKGSGDSAQGVCFFFEDSEAGGGGFGFGSSDGEDPGSLSIVSREKLDAVGPVTYEGVGAGFCGDADDSGLSFFAEGAMSGGAALSGEESPGSVLLSVVADMDDAGGGGVELVDQGRGCEGYGGGLLSGNVETYGKGVRSFFPGSAAGRLDPSQHLFQHVLMDGHSGVIIGGKRLGD